MPPGKVGKMNHNSTEKNIQDTMCLIALSGTEKFPINSGNR